MVKTSKLAPVFLSASIPDPKRHPKYISTADVLAIREAVTALTLLVTPKTKLVFGGHPAISPLVYLAAKSVQGERNVVIFQSKHFRGLIPKESKAFNCLVWTRDTGERNGSLTLMRKKMVESQNFGFGIFIGGMEGIEEECNIFQRTHPKALVFPIASTGAAARILYDCRKGKDDPETRNLLQNEYLYASLFRRLLGIT